MSDECPSPRGPKEPKIVGESGDVKDEAKQRENKEIFTTSKGERKKKVRKMN